MSIFFDFHTKDILLNSAPNSRTDYCLDESHKDGWTPFLSFPIINGCNFKCIYCGLGGEATASHESKISFDFIKRIVPIAMQKGVLKFRITGGEPFLHPDIFDILKFFSDLGVYTLINTNGSLITKYSDRLSSLNSNLRFAVSFDTLVPQKLTRISNKDCWQEVYDALWLLKEQNLLLRCNMVVGKYNVDEVFDMIKLCQQLKCDLKLLDIVSVPLPYGERQAVYQEINTLEVELAKKCDSIYSHEYTRGFGTPCFRYRFGETYVTVKNSLHGSHYDRKPGGVCSKCSYYPCHEGLYDIFALSDGRLCACRWTEKQKSEIIEEQLDYLINAFRRSEFFNPSSHEDMKRRVDLEK